MCSGRTGMLTSCMAQSYAQRSQRAYESQGWRGCQGRLISAAISCGLVEAE